MNVAETSLISLLQLIYRWRKQLLQITLAGAIVSAGVSLLLPNYYRAYTKAVAVGNNSATPNAVFGGGGAPFGSADDVDRLQNLAQSGELIDFLNEKFQLYKHYQIDSTSNRAKYDLGLEFAKLYSVEKDQYGALEISIEDRDPQMAADIINAAMQYIGELDKKAATANSRALMETYEKMVKKTSFTIDSLSSAINKINRTYKYPSIVLRRELLTQATPGMSADAQLGVIQKAGHISNDSLAAITENLYIAGVLDSRRADMNSQYISNQGLYLRAKAALESNVQTVQVIEKASKPQVKSRPKRAILVLAGAFLAMFAGIVFIVLTEQYETIDWKSIFKEGANGAQ
jgi:tyrosine-protein kinase Etk/Wzc